MSFVALLGVIASVIALGIALQNNRLPAGSAQGNDLELVKTITAQVVIQSSNEAIASGTNGALKNIIRDVFATGTQQVIVKVTSDAVLSKTAIQVALNNTETATVLKTTQAAQNLLPTQNVDILQTQAVQAFID